MGVVLLDAYVRLLSSYTGVPYIQLHFVFSMLSVFPFCYFFRFIKGQWNRTIASWVFGVFLLYQMIGLSLLHLVFETFITYLFIKYLGRKVSAFYWVAFNFIHLTYWHIIDYVYSYGQWTLGAETVVMMCWCKFSTVAFNYEDGAKSDEEWTEFYRSKRLTERPHFIEIFSYIFFFPSCLIGPSLEFHDFRLFMKLEGDYKNINYDKCNANSKKEFIKAIILILITSFFGGRLSQEYTGTEEFKHRNMVFKFIYVFFTVLILRTKYYSGWSMTETALSLCGFSYVVNKDEKNGEWITFDRVDNCNIWKIETHISNQVKIQYWNRSVHLWLRNYVYIRLQKKDRSNSNFVSFVTFILSAFWHGVYPNYYIFFFNMYQLEQVCKYLNYFDLFNKMENDTNKIRKGICWFMFFWIQDYGGLSFALFSFKENINFFSSFYYIPNVLLFFGFVYCAFIGKKPKRGSKEKDK